MFSGIYTAITRGLLILITATFFSCERIDVSKDTPQCVKKLIRESNPEEVWLYSYQGESVYLILASCCDQFNNVYDSTCKRICAPDGGITGSGDGLCASFYDNAIAIEKIWDKE